MSEKVKKVRVKIESEPDSDFQLHIDWEIAPSELGIFLNDLVLAKIRTEAKEERVLKGFLAAINLPKSENY